MCIECFKKKVKIKDFIRSQQELRNLRTSTIMLLEISIIGSLAIVTTCTIQGTSYMDSFVMRSSQNSPRGMDPCNPLYWYPKHIPEYCYYKITSTPHQNLPIPLPIPVPLPPASLYPPPPPAIPYGIPIIPSNPMLPVGSIPYPGPPAPNPYYRRRDQFGMVPGIPGLVTRDGGINIMPFSDVYADMLEKHKQKMFRRRFRHLYKDYEEYPRYIRHRTNKYKRKLYK